MTEREWLTQRRWYAPLFARYGETAGGVGWSAANQRKRFAALTAGWDFSQPVVVLDVGCGLAHLFDYLTDQGAHVRYRGVDILPAYVAAANRRLGGPVCTVLDAETEPLPPCDYAVASGVFNVALGSATRDQAHLQRIVTHMLAQARRGVAFDCLLTTHPQPVAGQAYYDESWLYQFVHGRDAFSTDAGIPGNFVAQLVTQEAAHAHGLPGPEG